MTEKQARTTESKLADASVWCLITSIVSYVFSGVLASSRLSVWVVVIVAYFSLFCFVISGPLALASIISRIKQKQSVKRNFKAEIVLGICVAGCLLLGVVMYGLKKMYTEIVPREICLSNIRYLRDSLNCYIFDYEDKLPADNWCDLLIAEANVSARNLVCPASDAIESEESCYALNINAAGKRIGGLPGDLVLLFECKKGWNHVGGKELLNMDNHQGKGCHVVYVNGEVEFVKAKDVDKLRWIVEGE